MDGDEDCHEHYLSLGLHLFQTCIKASHEDQLRILGKNSGVLNPSLSKVLEEDGPEWDNPMYDAWRNKAFQGFYGDSDRDGPNAAWTWSPGNKVEIRYYQPDKVGLRKWGYVMWDKERLDHLTILQEDPQNFCGE